MADLLALRFSPPAAVTAASPEFAIGVAPPPEARLRDWLATQAAVVEHWIDRLVAEAGDARLIGVLEQHAAFLREAAEL